MLNFNQTSNKADNEVIINGFSFGFLTDKDTERLVSIIKGMQNGTEIKASKPTSTAKAVEKKPTKVVLNEEPKDYSTDYEITLEKDGIHINVGDRIGKKSSKIAASKLYNAGCVRGDKYNYYVVGKGGKMSAKLTKEVFDRFEGGKIHIANEDYKWRS